MIAEKKYNIVSFQSRQKAEDMYDVDRTESRFAIADTNGNVVDNANGYGYKTFDKALAAMRYKFGGGKQRAQAASNAGRSAFKEWQEANPTIRDIADRFDYACESCFKDPEVTENDMWSWIENDIGVAIPKLVRKHIENL